MDMTRDAGLLGVMASAVAKVACYLMQYRCIDADF
jgi:hypothetical protein